VQIAHLAENIAGETFFDLAAIKWTGEKSPRKVEAVEEPSK
jgi:hypothetical protein